MGAGFQLAFCEMLVAGSFSLFPSPLNTCNSFSAVQIDNGSESFHIDDKQAVSVECVLLFSLCFILVLHFELLACRGTITALIQFVSLGSSL